jgi:hypothetical protein
MDDATTQQLLALEAGVSSKVLDDPSRIDWDEAVDLPEHVLESMSSFSVHYEETLKYFPFLENCEVISKLEPTV